MYAFIIFIYVYYYVFIFKKKLNCYFLSFLLLYKKTVYRIAKKKKKRYIWGKYVFECIITFYLFIFGYLKLRLDLYGSPGHS